RDGPSSVCLSYDPCGPRLNVRRKAGGAGDSVEVRALVTCALEFEESRRRGDREDSVEEPAGGFSLRSGGDDRAEERGSGDAADRCADIVSDQAQRLVVGGLEPSIIVLGLSVLHEIGRQLELGQRLGYGLVEVLLPTRVDTIADRGVERFGDLVSVFGDRGGDDAHRS